MPFLGSDVDIEIVSNAAILAREVSNNLNLTTVSNTGFRLVRPSELGLSGDASNTYFPSSFEQSVGLFIFESLSNPGEFVLAYDAINTSVISNVFPSALPTPPAFNTVYADDFATVYTELQNDFTVDSILATGFSLGGVAVNQLSQSFGTHFGSIPANFVAFGSELINQSSNLINIGFGNDYLFGLYNDYVNAFVAGDPGLAVLPDFTSVVNATNAQIQSLDPTSFLVDLYAVEPRNIGIEGSFNWYLDSGEIPPDARFSIDSQNFFDFPHNITVLTFALQRITNAGLEDEITFDSRVIIDFTDDTVTAISPGNPFIGGEPGEPVFILGEDGFSDTLIGHDGVDFIIGQGESDRLEGLGGNDFLNGGDDNDIILGGDDDDRLIGEGGSDQIDGGNGNDIIFGDNESEFQTTANTVVIPSTGEQFSVSLTLPDITQDSTIPLSGFVSRTPVTSSEFNIAFVIDVSGSTNNTFNGAVAVGDLNGDGRANTILDAEIAGIEALLQGIEAQVGAANINASIIGFQSSAFTAFSGNILSDNNGNGISDAIDALRSLQDVGGTNFQTGLQQSIDFFNNAPNGQNLVFFLSDGENNSIPSTFADEVDTLLDDNGIDATIRSFGVGANSDPDDLDLLDDGINNGSEVIVTDPSLLSQVLIDPNIDQSDVDRVEILLNGNVVTTIPGASLTSTPLGLRFSFETVLSGLQVNTDDIVEVRAIASDPLGTTVSTVQIVEDLPNVGAGDGLQGGAGNDLIFGGVGGDLIDGGTGNDVLLGEGGNDTLSGAGVSGPLLSPLNNPVSINGSTATINATLNSVSGTQQLNNFAFTSNGVTPISVINDVSDFDTEIFVFSVNADGSLGDFIGNDDNDPNIPGFNDARLDFPSLPAGDYVVVVGSFAFSEADARSGLNNDSDSGNFQLTITGATAVGLLPSGPLTPESDNDTLNGGDGVDTADYSNAITALTIDLNQQGSSQDTGAGLDTLIDIENLIGGSAGDMLTGDDNANTFFANLSDGDDTIDGRGNTDTYDASRVGGVVQINLFGSVTGSAGNDAITSIENAIGSNFNDVLSGDNGNNRLEGGLGNDTINGNGGNDTVVANLSDGDDTLTGGGGFDVLDFSAVQGVVQINQLGGVITGSAGNDTLLDVFEQIIGSNFNDALSGGNGGDVLDGNNGNDQFFANGGDDLVRGGEGNDTVFHSTNDGNDRLMGGNGFDVLDYSSLQGVVQVNQLDGTTTGTANNDILLDVFEAVIGSNFGDVLSGGNGINVLNGGGGDDQLFANGGNDQTSGGAGNDTITLGLGDDRHDYRNGEDIDTITDFNAGAGSEDAIILTFHSAATSFAQMQMAGMFSQNGLNTEIDLGGGDMIILNNINVGDLHEDDFIF